MRVFEARHGLRPMLGGRHPGAGTANAIVSLGALEYLELIAVVDPEEARASGRSMRVARAVDAGATFATWVLRTEDVDAVRNALAIEQPVRDGARTRPDGTRIEWKSLDLPGDGSGIPFLIQWSDLELHPGRHGAGRVRKIVLAADASLRRVLSAVDIQGVEMDVRDGAEPRLLEIEIELPERSLTIR